MSVGGEISAMLPIVNAPMRLYYAYNLLRLYENVQGESLITRSMFPAGGAGDFTYQEAIRRMTRCCISASRERPSA
jgi:outer membrane protein insertion porin family